jgi:hypothetical protein
MGPVAVPGVVSGADIVQDLCDRIAEQLSRDCHLRQTDSFQSYNAEVSIRLQALDFDTVAIAEHISVGNLDAARPQQQVTVTASVAADEVRARLGLEPEPSLEVPVDPAGAADIAPAAKPGKRYYYPRGSKPRN